MKSILLRKQILVLLPVILLIATFPISADETPEGFVYTDNGTEITITGYTGSSASIIIPQSIVGKPVTTIGPHAFATNLTLQSVFIPASVERITVEAFQGCSNLESVNLETTGSPGLHEIGVMAFQNTALPQISLPASLELLAENAFEYCDNLTDIDVDPLNSVYKSTDGVVFTVSGETLITYPRGRAGSYSIPDGVVTAGPDSFSTCQGLSSISFPPTPTTIDWYAFHGCSGLESVTLPWTVKTLKQGAFYGSAVASVGFQVRSVSGILVSGINIIEGYVFSNCNNLTSILLPRTVTSISPGAFADNTVLSSITVNAANEYYTSVEGALYDKSVTILHTWPLGKADPTVFPSSLTTIGEYAFYGRSDMTHIRLPDQIETIGTGAFMYCHGLTSIRIPPSVTLIQTAAFRYCSNLENAFFAGSAAPELTVNKIDPTTTVFSDTASGFQIFFRQGASGYTTPTWYDYPCSSRANAIPVLTAIGNKTVQVGQPITFTIQATDTDEDTLSYAATGNTP